MTHPEASESAVRELIATFVAGWNSVDPAKLASVFAADADFTAITGLRAQGRDQVGRGHHEILATIYRGTNLSATVESIRFLRPDVAVLDTTFVLRRDGSPVFGIPHTSAGIIATQDGGVWSIAVFRNMVPFARPVAGPLERELNREKTA